MIRFLAISVLLICTACSLKTTEGLRKVPIIKSEIQNPYFSDAKEDYVYKAKITIYGKDFGGILIIKKIEENAHRVVFTTEFGNKLFDFEFQGNTFKKNFILNELDKKIVVNVLQSDFKLLINETILVSMQFESDGNWVFKSEDGNRFNYYFENIPSERLAKIVRTSKTKEKVIITFEDSEYDNIAERIEIQHKNIKLHINLEKFKEN